MYANPYKPQVDANDAHLYGSYTSEPSGPPPSYGASYGSGSSAYAAEAGRAPPAYENITVPVPPARPPPQARFGAAAYKDLWATVLFVLHLIGFAVLMIIGMTSLSMLKTDGTNTTTNIDPNASKRALVILLVVSAVSSVLSAGYTYLMRVFPRQLIQVTMVLSVAVCFVVAAANFVAGIVFGGIIMVLFGLLTMWCWYAWRSHIPFATAMLETVASIAREYPSAIVASIVTVIVQFIFSVVWVLTVVGCSLHFDNNFGGIAIFLAFSLYWTSQVIHNTLHVTICGLFASYYFLRGTAQEQRNPCLKSAGRALTTSFGPVCFGSLLVALIETLRYLIRSASGRNNAGSAIADCLLGCIEGYVRYFNRWAYTQVAIYGKSFCDAGRDTFALLDRGLGTGLVNDFIIGRVLGIGSLLVGLFAGIVGFVIEYIASKDSGIAFAIAIAGFGIGALMMSVVTAPIDSGHITTIVCFCEDPEALARTKPMLYQRFAETYPDPFRRIIS